MKAKPVANLPIAYPSPTDLTAPYTDFNTPVEEHNQFDADLTNISAAALITRWNQKSMSAKDLSKLVKDTTAFVTHRRKLFGLSYGTPDNRGNESKRPRTYPID